MFSHQSSSKRLPNSWQFRLGAWFGIVVVAIAMVGSIVRGETPNIVLLVADDLGWNDIGYHNSEIKTPHLDRLAKQGVELDCHYVMPQCTPTRVALMTGRYPSRFGPHCCQASNDQAFPHGTPTLASMLRASGYATAILGKWHLGSRPEWGPNHFGFDFSYGSLAGAVGMYDHRYRLDSPFADTWHRNHQPVSEEGHVTDLITSAAVQWIEDHRHKPFFLYVPYHTVHTPLVEDTKWLATHAHIDDPERRLYAAAVGHLDGSVGRIEESLALHGLLEKTLLIFTSDNGAQVNHGGNAYPPPDPPLTDFSSNEPLRGKKTEVFEGGMRVPAFVSWPGHLRPHRMTIPVHAVDWLPTLAGLVGSDVPCGQSPADTMRGPCDGIDIWPFISQASTTAPDRILYWVWGARHQRVALRFGPWKILRQGANQAWQLFHLLRDPYESTDLFERHPDQANAMLARVARQSQRDATTDPTPRATPP